MPRNPEASHRGERLDKEPQLREAPPEGGLLATTKTKKVSLRKQIIAEGDPATVEKVGMFRRVARERMGEISTTKARIAEASATEKRLGRTTILDDIEKKEEAILQLETLLEGDKNTNDFKFAQSQIEKLKADIAELRAKLDKTTFEENREVALSEKEKESLFQDVEYRMERVADAEQDIELFIEACRGSRDGEWKGSGFKGLGQFIEDAYLSPGTVERLLLRRLLAEPKKGREVETEIPEVLVSALKTEKDRLVDERALADLENSAFKNLPSAIQEEYLKARRAHWSSSEHRADLIKDFQKNREASGQSILSLESPDAAIAALRIAMFSKGTLSPDEAKTVIASFVGSRAGGARLMSELSSEERKAFIDHVHGRDVVSGMAKRLQAMNLYGPEAIERTFVAGKRELAHIEVLKQLEAKMVQAPKNWATEIQNANEQAVTAVLIDARGALRRIELDVHGERGLSPDIQRKRTELERVKRTLGDIPVPSTYSGTGGNAFRDMVVSTVRVLKRPQAERDDSSASMGVEAFGYVVEERCKKLEDRVQTIQSKSISQGEVWDGISCVVQDMEREYKMHEGAFERFVQNIEHHSSVLNFARVRDLTRQILLKERLDIAAGEQLRHRDTADVTRMYAERVAGDCERQRVLIVGCRNDYEQILSAAKDISARLGAAIAEAEQKAGGEEAQIENALKDVVRKKEEINDKISELNAKWIVFGKAAKIEELEKERAKIEEEKRKLTEQLRTVKDFIAYVAGAGEGLKTTVRKPEWSQLGALRYSI